MNEEQYEPAVEDSDYLHRFGEIMRFTVEDYERAVNRGDMTVVLSSMESLKAYANDIQVFAKHTVRYTRDHEEVKKP